MTEKILNIGARVAIRKSEFNRIITALGESGHATMGPKVKDQVLTYAPVTGLDDLPQGYTSEQEPGYYRLIQGNHQRYFDITPGPDSWKKFLFPPRTLLFEAARENGSWKEIVAQKQNQKYAFIGVRPCELAAIGVQDNVFIRDDYIDPFYSSRRENLLILVVNCLHPSSTCFCTSMGSGPNATNGFDLSFTELDEIFLVEIGSDAGLALIELCEWELASAYYLQVAEEELARAKQAIKRSIEDPESVPEMLLENLNHPHWDDVGRRCLSCTNCTIVCPTCFCWDVEDKTNLAGDQTQRTRVWDSCFNPSYSAQAGGNTRPTTRSRYRQWLSHKMGSWVKQFGESGCVGCGRCIVWCPAKIDITEEIKALQEVRA